MFYYVDPGLYFLTLDLTKIKVLLNLGLQSFVIEALKLKVNQEQLWYKFCIKKFYTTGWNKAAK